MADNKVVFAEERKELILNLINQQEKVYVSEISKTFKVSTSTIRNDLNELEKDGKLIRTHGGAISSEYAEIELKTEQKKVKNTSNKIKIATKALDYISDGEIILLDTGTTTGHLATLLKNIRNITVITNDIEIAIVLEEAQGLNVILIGGMLRKGFHCTIGMFAQNILKDITVDKAFIATNGIDIATGLYTPDVNQAEAKKRMIKCARECYLLSDSTKIGRKAFVKFADFNEFNMIITDEEINIIDYKGIGNKTKILKV